MRIRLRYFARMAEITACRSELIEIEQESVTIGQAVEWVLQKYPAFKAVMPHLRYARNMKYAESSQFLADGDEIALIPPIAGG